MIKTYTKEITFKDISSISQEYVESMNTLFLHIELIDGTKLEFKHYGECNTFCTCPETKEQANKEYEEFMPVLEQYLEFSRCVQRDMMTPSEARKFLEENK